MVNPCGWAHVRIVCHRPRWWRAEIVELMLKTLVSVFPAHCSAFAAIAVPPPSQYPPPMDGRCAIKWPVWRYPVGRNRCVHGAATPQRVAIDTEQLFAASMVNCPWAICGACAGCLVDTSATAALASYASLKQRCRYLIAWPQQQSCL